MKGLRHIILHISDFFNFNIEILNKRSYFHWIIALISIPLSILFISSIGWILFSMLTIRGGMIGGIYYYYSLERWQLEFLWFFMIIVISLPVLMQIIYFIKKEIYKLYFSYLLLVNSAFICFILISALPYYYTPKG